MRDEYRRKSRLHTGSSVHKPNLCSSTHKVEIFPSNTTTLQHSRMVRKKQGTKRGSQDEKIGYDSTKLQSGAFACSYYNNLSSMLNSLVCRRTHVAVAIVCLAHMRATVTVTVTVVSEVHAMGSIHFCRDMRMCVVGGFELALCTSIPTRKRCTHSSALQIGIAKMGVCVKPAKFRSPDGAGAAASLSATRQAREVR